MSDGPIPCAVRRGTGFPPGGARASAAVGLLVALGLGAAGCGEAGPGDATTVRDSAGVTIVESHAPGRDAGADWTLGRDPLVEIGAVEAAPEYMFNRVEDAVLAPDGRIIVADGGSREVRFYDSDGRFLRAAGGPGDGPGEYRLINDIGRGPGDTVWVYDFTARRYTLLDDSGAVVRTMTLGPALSNVGSVGRLGDGTFVVQEYWSGAGGTGRIRTGLTRAPAAVARIPAAGGRPDTVGVFPGRQVHIGSEAGRAVMSAPLFAHHLSAVAGADEIFIGDQEGYEIRVYSADGGLRRLIRIPDLELRLTDEEIEAAVARRLAAEPADRRTTLRAHLESMEVPETRPAYRRMLVDRQGVLWVEDYVPNPGETVSWRVFDADGRLLDRVEAPARFRILDIGRDRVVGVWRDELDVERIRVYALDGGQEI